MRFPSSLDLTNPVRNHKKDSRKFLELLCLRSGEVSGEATDGTFIGVEELGRVRGMRERMDDGGVLVMVKGEKGWLV